MWLFSKGLALVLQDHPQCVLTIIIHEDKNPTAMERELHTFPENVKIVVTSIPRGNGRAGKQQGVAQRHAE